MAPPAKLTAQLKALMAKKEMLFRRVQNLYDLSRRLNEPASRASFKLRYETLEETREAFSSAIEQINLVSLEIDPEFNPDYQSIEAVDELYCHVQAAAKEVIVPSATPVTLANAPQSRIKARLPKLEIVSFSGDVKTWPVFYETFKSMIHENSELSELEKIQYLVGKLSGHALSVCAGLPPVAANYNIIWGALVNKYQDKRNLAVTYLDQILDLKPSNVESAAALNQFLEQFSEPVAALRQLQLPDLAGFILLCLALKKLDPETGKHFEMSLADQSVIPTIDDLLTFVTNQSKILMRTRKVNNISTPVLKKQSVPNKSKTTNSFVVQKSLDSEDKSISEKHLCVICDTQEHNIYGCPTLLKLSAKERYDLVKTKSLCLNCLGSKHRVAACKSKNSCSRCKLQHHTLLHFERPQPVDTAVSAVVAPSSSQHTADSMSHCSIVEPTVSLSSTGTSNLASTVLLSTAVIHVFDQFGRAHPVRVLVDSASQSNFLTETCCKRLGLSKTKVKSSVRGIGLASRPIQGATSFTICSRLDANEKFSLNAFVIDKITDSVPTVSLKKEALQHLEGLPLADENFHIPGQVDGLLGAEIFPHVIRTGKVTGPPATPVAIQSSLGYIVMGSAPVNVATSDLQTFCTSIEPPLETLVQRFWTLEQVPAPAVLDRDEEDCEKLFVDNYSRDSSGRYTVSLPFKSDPALLGDSFSMAKRRFLSLERKLEANNSSLKLDYHAFMSDYLKQGHMSRITEENSVSKTYFLPHHCVLKPQSSSTKLRVVFDASAKSDSSLSLNDILYTGPKLQADIVIVLLNFRLYPVAMTADLKQMYRQIVVAPHHRNFQQILWRFAPSDELSVYQLNTVTFGVKSAPFLALRVVRQLVSDEQHEFPLAASVVIRDTYMDDVASSVATDAEAIELYRQLVALFATGGFDLLKWSTNSTQLLENIPVERRASTAVEFEGDDSIKILGLQWIPSNDVFSFVVSTQYNGCTKRSILSALARIFDPLGLVSPVTLYAKLLIKELWKLQIGWDDAPPEHIRNAWIRFQEELPSLSSFSVPRHVSVFVNSKVTVMGFADSSEKGYGSVIYVRSQLASNEARIVLLCAKSKVAPMKSVSIPRLELCAALLLADLMAVVLENYRSRCTIGKVYAFSDSTVTLHWIKSSPHRWKTFVANRVAQIQDKIAVSNWFHIDGKENPADCLSRGLMPSALLDHPLWLTGPSWASLDESDWPIHSEIDSSEGLSEERIVAFPVVVRDEQPLQSLVQRMSSFGKLLRVTAYVLRFAKRLRPASVEITALELDQAEKVIIKVTQDLHFREDIRALEKGQICSPALRKLHPFLQDGLLRVGGRLANASLAFDQQHPVLLPKKDHVVNLIIDQCHRDNLHTGPHLVLTLLRQRYWILSGRGVVRQRTQSCNICFRTCPRPTFPLMGDLPPCRVQQAKPFGHTGVDYAGPLNITISRRRGAKTQKAYICLFVCLSTKAIHLELASDLSTATFLAAFKRFLSRRGPCSVIYSDNGTNFIGAKASLDALYDLVQSQDFSSSVREELTKQKIEWKLNPPSAPHFGGIWESNVKSVKTHLYKVMGSQILTYEELATLLTQVEALLNSRPLCVLSSDPSAPTALTPAHFLTLTPLRHLPASDVTAEPLNRLARFELIDRMVQDYWRRWHTEYLSTLQVRERWNVPTSPVKSGLVVVLKQENAAPLQWPLAVVEEVFPGRDGIVRVATVRTQSGVYKRPVAKLCPLPTQ